MEADNPHQPRHISRDEAIRATFSGSLLGVGYYLSRHIGADGCGVLHGFAAGAISTPDIVRLTRIALGQRTARNVRSQQ